MEMRTLPALVALALPLTGCTRVMTLHPEARYVAIHCTQGKGDQPDTSVTLAADYERGTPDQLFINNQKVASFDTCHVVVVEPAGICGYDSVPACEQGDCSLAIRSCH